MGSRTLTGKEAKSCRNAARMESPMIRKGQVVRFTLCTPESEPCPQFAAYTNLGSWVVANCEDCKPPPALTPSPDIGLSCTCLIAGVIIIQICTISLCLIKFGFKTAALLLTTD